MTHIRLDTAYPQRILPIITAENIIESSQLFRITDPRAWNAQHTFTILRNCTCTPRNFRNWNFSRRLIQTNTINITRSDEYKRDTGSRIFAGGPFKRNNWITKRAPSVQCVRNYSDKRKTFVAIKRPLLFPGNAMKRS